jgi:hypothetical protein
VGVAGSNPATPTRYPLVALNFHNYPQLLQFLERPKYTRPYTGASCGWSGNARKRLPDDVRQEYVRLYGAHHEAKFSAPKTTKSHEAKRLYGNWLAEVEGRIAAIRAGTCSLIFSTMIFPPP